MLVCHNFLKEYALGAHRTTNVQPRKCGEQGTFYLLQGHGLGLAQDDWIAFNYLSEQSVDKLGNFIFFIGQIQGVIYDRDKANSDRFQAIVETHKPSEELLAELNYAHLAMVRFYKEPDAKEGQGPTSDSRDFGYVIYTDLLEKTKFREMLEEDWAKKGG